MKNLQRPALFLILVVGVLMVLWPVGERVYGWWNQRALLASWHDAAVAAPATSGSQVDTARVTPVPKATTAKATTGKAAVAKTPLAVKVKAPATPAPVATVGPTPRPTKAGWVPTRIVIPHIGLDAVVVRGIDNAALRRGPGHDKSTALPGQSGNCVIAAHRNLYGAWFYKLDHLYPGTIVELRTPRAIYSYEVEYSGVVSEEETSILDPPALKDTPPRLTLYTCTLPKSPSREVIIAELKSVQKL